MTNWGDKVKVNIDEIFKGSSKKEPDEEPKGLQFEELNDFGLVSSLGIRWIKDNPDISIFTARGTLRKQFFEWYLDSCTLDHMKQINEDKLSEANAMLLAEKFTERSKEKIEEEKANKVDIQKYNDLVKQCDEAIIHATEAQELYHKYKEMTMWLYNFMSEKMIFKPEIKELEQDDISTLKDIKEAIE